MREQFPTIRRVLKKRNAAIDELVEDQPEVFELVDGCLECSSSFMRVMYTKLVEEQFLRSQFTLFLAHTIFDYLEDAFLLTCSRRLDQAGALCRMAAEATRDLLRICEHPELGSVFFEKETSRKEYQKHFRFELINRWKRYCR